jgi:hypothetical protein
MAVSSIMSQRASKEVDGRLENAAFVLVIIFTSNLQLNTIYFQATL